MPTDFVTHKEMSDEIKGLERETRKEKHDIVNKMQSIFMELSNQMGDFKDSVTENNTKIIQEMSTIKVLAVKIEAHDKDIHEIKGDVHEIVQNIKASDEKRDKKDAVRDTKIETNQRMILIWVGWLSVLTFVGTIFWDKFIEFLTQ